METSPIARAFSFQGCFNFRDLGGYAGLDGRPVRWRRLFRSDSLHRLGEPDRDAFAALGVRTVVDLRRPFEVERDGRVTYDHVAYHHIHPEHAEWRDSSAARADGAALGRWLADRYLDLAGTGAAGLGRALRVIADTQAAPVVVHCVAGKDRTGVVCALTLSLVGVADEDIAADYALSTAASERFNTWLHETHPDLPALPAPFLASPADAMLTFLGDLRARYGSIESYVGRGGVGPAEIESLRAHLLAG